MNEKWSLKEKIETWIVNEKKKFFEEEKKCREHWKQTRKKIVSSFKAKNHEEKHCRREKMKIDCVVVEEWKIFPWHNWIAVQ